MKSGNLLLSSTYKRFAVFFSKLDRCNFSVENAEKTGFFSEIINEKKNPVPFLFIVGVVGFLL
jgi:hypothetical protein